MTATPSSGSLAVLRRRNSSAVLEEIMRAGRPLRLADVMATTGLSRPTVETVVDGLSQQGWVVEDAADPAPKRRAGRPARRWTFNARAGHVLGVDIGANSVAVSLADLRGERLATVRRPVSPGTGPAERMAALRAVIGETVDAQGVPASSVMAVTIGTPGTVSPSQHRIGIAPAIPGWAASDLTAELAQIVGCELELENDANLAVVGERAQGVAHDATDMLFLLLGERLGAGVMVNDALVRGRDGAAGEIGYVPVNDGAATPAGWGPLEARVNASALVRLGRAALDGPGAARLRELCGDDPAALTAEAITRAAAEGDGTAIDVLARLTHILAEGLAPALLTLNPEVVVLGGGISRAGSVLLEVFEPQLKPLLLYPPEIRLSRLGSDAVLVGAVHQATSRVQRDVLTRISA